MADVSARATRSLRQVGTELEIGDRQIYLFATFDPMFWQIGPWFRGGTWTVAGVSLGPFHLSIEIG